MKSVTTGFCIIAAITFLTLFFSLSIGIAPAAGATLCDRFPSLSDHFPSCRDNPPPPPPVPPPASPPAPPPTPSPTPIPSRSNERDGVRCEHYTSDPRAPVPLACDSCPNVPGWQTVKYCQDKFCTDHGGSWTGTSCEFPPPPENSLSLCTDGLDNDEDSRVDLEDSDCESFKPKIIVTKIVINDNGGTALPSDFSLFVASAATGQISVNSGATTTLPHAGEWIVGEITRPGYEPKGFGGDCANGSPVIAAGETMTCTITNDDIASGGGGAGGGGGGGGAPAPSPTPSGGGGSI